MSAKRLRQGSSSVATKRRANEAMCGYQSAERSSDKHVFRRRLDWVKTGGSVPQLPWEGRADSVA